MAKKVPIERLGEEIEKILKEYEEHVLTSSDDAVKKAAQAGVRALKASSRSTFGGTGKYAAGWTVTYEKNRLSATGIIHNSVAGLPHLLEHGHAKAGGGRVAGRPHIAPIEQKIVQEFEQKLRKDL